MMSRGCNSLMENIRAVDFAIVETVLYLDAYPSCAKAQCYYHELVKRREMLVDEYESKFGPLTMFGNRDKKTWDWTARPFPWEYDAN